MISILDYGAGNLRSVQNTLSELGAEFELVHDSGGLRRAGKIILPGVGHFGQMMRALDQMQVKYKLAEGGNDLASDSDTPANFTAGARGN